MIPPDCIKTLLPDSTVKLKFAKLTPRVIWLGIVTTELFWIQTFWGAIALLVKVQSEVTIQSPDRGTEQGTTCWETLPSMDDPAKTVSTIEKEETIAIIKR